MSIDPATWDALEAGTAVGGSSRLRIHPGSSHDLFVSVVKPGLRRRLVLELPSVPQKAAERARDSRGVRVAVEDAEGGARALVVELADRLFEPVFDPLVNDIAAAAAREPSSEGAAVALLTRLDFWRSLLRDLDADGMGNTRRRGLVGELHCMEHLLLGLGTVPAGDAVLAWTGPLAANQDFQFPGGAVEVKATAAKKPRTLVITNERELDGTGVGNLLLVAVELDERQGGTGRSLNTMVQEVRHMLSDPTAAQTFDERVAAYGYLPGQEALYDEPRYTVRETVAWHVRDTFPRIVESELRPGVGDVTYQIVTAGLDQFAVPLARVAAVARGSAP